MAARLFKSGTYSSLISEATDVIAQINFNIIDINEKEKKNAGVAHCFQTARSTFASIYKYWGPS